MRWKIQCGPTRGLVAVAFVVLVLVPSARPDDGPKKGEATCVDHGKAGTHEGPGECQDSQKNGAAQVSIEKEKGKKWNLVRAWLDLGEHVQATQPDWLSPLATTSGRLKPEFRYDIWDQPASSGGNRSYQFGGNKGLEFITSSRTQILLGVPTYTLVFGKGWRRFDVQSTLGVNLPAGGTAKLGRQLLWNTAFQYRAAWKLWPELEANSTFYATGKNAGGTQLFLTPGLGIGRAHLAGRFRLSSAVGVQIAATQFHTYNHRWMFSMRVSF